MSLFPLESHTGWWVEIHTQMPQCTYYFGPFMSHQEAQDHQDGYIADLAQEGAQYMRVSTQQGHPKELTIF